MSIQTPYGQQPMPPVPPQPQSGVSPQAGHENSTSFNTGEASKTAPPEHQYQQQHHQNMHHIGGNQGLPPWNLHHTQMQVLPWGPQLNAPLYQPPTMHPQHMGSSPLLAAATASLMRDGPPPWYGGDWSGTGYGAGYPQHDGGGNLDPYRDRKSNIQGGGRVTAFERTALADSLLTFRQDTSGPVQVNTDDHSASSSYSLSTSSPQTAPLEIPAPVDFLTAFCQAKGKAQADSLAASSQAKDMAQADPLVASCQAKGKARADPLINLARLAKGKALANSLVTCRLATAADVRRMGLAPAALRGMLW
jgi:hypothetical protein